MATKGFSLPFDVAEPTLSLSLDAEVLDIDGKSYQAEFVEQDGPTLRIHQIVETWESLSLRLKLQITAGSPRANLAELSALVRTICSAAPHRQAVLLEHDGTSWVGTLQIDRDSYRGSLLLTGELIADPGKRGIAKPRATYEPSIALRIELDSADAPPAGMLTPRWINFSEEANRYRELKDMGPKLTRAATSLIAFNLEKQEWHWLWNKENKSWRRALPDKLFGKTAYLRKAVSIADGIATIRAALLLGSQSALAEFWSARAQSGEDAVLVAATDPFFQEVRTWSLTQYAKHRGFEAGGDLDSFIFEELDEFPAGATSATERAEAFLAKVISFVSAESLAASKFEEALEGLRDATTFANHERSDS
jgi:hypothetical protein